MLRVSQVMIRLSVSLYSHNTIGDALALMREKRVPGLPIQNEQGRLLGLVTKDQVLEQGLENYAPDQKAVQYLTTRFVPLKEDALVEDVWDLPFDVFPVLNSREEMTGVISRYALGYALFQQDQQRRQELEAVFNSTHNGILAINKHGIITSLNPAAEKPTRSSKVEAVGKFLTDVIVPTGLLDVLRSGVPEFGVKFQVGRRQYITNRTPIIKDGEVIGAVGVFQDVSELESVLKELRSVKELNEELRTIVDSADNGIIICDGTGQILRCNPAVERILGLSRQDLVGHPLQELADRAIFARNIIGQIKRQGGSVSSLEKPGTDHTLVVTANPVYDEDGEIARIVINIRDMSELLALREALEEHKLLSEKYQSEIAQMRSGGSDQEVIARSDLMKNVLDLVWRVSQVESPVVLIGERGVGKEALAKLIHYNGLRKTGPFYKLNCASMPEHMLASELFGWRGGDAAGTRGSKSGIFELAGQGTVYLERIDKLPINLQVKLLQVLRDKAVTPIGGLEALPVDVRLVVSTNQTLNELVDEGVFLEELFFSLNIVPIRIPPLHERREDILPLMQSCLEENNRRYSFEVEFSPEGLKLLLNYSWPGNLREMENVLERLVVTAKGRYISAAEVDAALHRKEQVSGSRVSVAGVIPLKTAIDDVEQQLVTMAMEQFGTTVRAAEALGVNQSTVVRKLQKIRVVSPEKA